MKHLSKLLFIGILLQLLVLALAYAEANGDTVLFFQAAARLSGRLSLIYFGILFVYSTLNPFMERDSDELVVKVVLARNFLVMHGIHFILLATAIRLSGYALVPYRLIGGVLAYAMIVLYPFILQEKIFSRISKKVVQLIYLNYVWLIFLITYLTRVFGNPMNVTGDSLTYKVFFLTTVALMVWRLIWLFQISRANSFTR